LKQAWSTVAEIEPVLEKLEEHPQFLQMASPNETVVVVSLAVTIGETSGMMTICIPHIFLEPIIPKLSAQHWMQTTTDTRDDEAYEKLSNQLEDTIVSVKSILGETQITIEEFLKLSQDDMIALHQPIDEPLPLTVNGHQKYLVQPGKYKNKLAVQVLEQTKGGDPE